MAELAIHPPVHLVIHPDEPIRSLEAALKVVQRHAGENRDHRTQGLIRRLESASTPEEADEAGKAFRAWAEEHGLLLVPPEDAATPAPPGKSAAH
jgi:adenosylmethionine-8-amino-7-oxononanoate aminotransferase